MKIVENAQNKVKKAATSAKFIVAEVNDIRRSTQAKPTVSSATPKEIPVIKASSNALFNNDVYGVLNSHNIETLAAFAPGDYKQKNSSNNFYRTGANGGHTLTAKAWRNIEFARTVGAPYTTLAHQEKDPVRREYLFCRLLGVRFPKESALFNAVINDIDKQLKINPDLQTLKDFKNDLQIEYRNLAFGTRSNDQNHFSKEKHQNLQSLILTHIKSIDPSLIEAETQLEKDQNKRRREFLEGLFAKAQKEEKDNDGVRKRQKNTQDIAREMFCDENVVTFSSNGGLTIRVGNSFHFFGSDPQMWAEGFNQMIRYVQDRGSDPWASLVVFEGPDYYQEWARAECRKNSIRWWPQYDEAFLVYGDLVPMVANQNIQMLAKGYWAEQVFVTDIDGKVIMDRVESPDGTVGERARTTVIIMHDPEKCKAAGVSPPETHIRNFHANAPKRHDESFVYQPYSFNQKPVELRYGVYIPLKDDGTSIDPVHAFDADRLYDSKLTKPKNLTALNGELQAAQLGGQVPMVRNQPDEPVDAANTKAKLEDNISASLSAGMQPDEIKQAMENIGYPSSDIERQLNKFSGDAASPENPNPRIAHTLTQTEAKVKINMAPVSDSNPKNKAKATQTGSLWVPPNANMGKGNSNYTAM